MKLYRLQRWLKPQWDFPHYGHLIQQQRVGGKGSVEKEYWWIISCQQEAAAGRWQHCFYKQIAALSEYRPPRKHTHKLAFYLWGLQEISFALLESSQDNQRALDLCGSQAVLLLTAAVQPNRSANNQRWLFVSFLPELLPLIPHQDIWRPLRNYESWRLLISSLIFSALPLQTPIQASLRLFDACCLPISYTLCLPCQAFPVQGKTKPKVFGSQLQVCIMIPTRVSSGKRNERGVRIYCHASGSRSMKE